MTQPFVEIEQHGAGRYAVQASSFAGPVRFELVLPDQHESTGLGNDPATARAHGYRSAESMLNMINLCCSPTPIPGPHP